MAALFLVKVWEPAGLSRGGSALAHAEDQEGGPVSVIGVGR